MEADRSWRWFLPGLMATTALTKIFLAWRFPAFLTGDDVEVIETAARYAVGLDYRPWVIRSLFHPLLFAFPFVKAGALAGFADGRAMSFLAAWPDVAFSTAGIWLVARLALSFGLSSAAARAASLLYAFHWLPLAYVATPFPRPISLVLLLAAFLLVADGAQAPWRAAAAGALAACAFAVRWSEGMVLVPLLGFALHRSPARRAATLGFVAGGFLAGVLFAVGLFDLWTWGSPFASLLAFARFLADPSLGGFPRRSFIWYGWSAFRWLGPVLPLLVLAGARDKRTRAPLSIALATLLLFSLSPLKELRYLQVAIPFLAIGA